jgi:ABC-2 type transport system permease protein
MSAVPHTGPSRIDEVKHSMAYQRRVLQVIAGVEFKLKYADSALGYIWSLVKPLSYFTVIWMLLGGIFKAGVAIGNYPLYLLIGIVLIGWFNECVGAAMSSIVMRGGLLRRIYFPRIVIPISLTATASITFAVNLVAVVVFILGSRIMPRPSWLLLPLLLVEQYMFQIGLGLILATLFVRFRDIAQIWDLTAQLLFFATPVMYSIVFLPKWAQKIVLLNPTAQVMQDVRRLILGDQMQNATIGWVYFTPWARLIPFTIAVLTCILGVWMFQRNAPKFAEQV